MTSLAQHDGQDAAESTVVYAASSSSVLAGEASPFACLRTSVVRQADRALFASAALARVTLARMSPAFAVQMKGLGSKLCSAM
jgi:hypothetical protein